MPFTNDEAEKQRLKDFAAGLKLLATRIDELVAKMCIPGGSQYSELLTDWNNIKTNAMVVDDIAAYINDQ